MLRAGGAQEPVKFATASATFEASRRTHRAVHALDPDNESGWSTVGAPAELELDAFTLVQPDVFVLPLVDGKLPQSQQDTGTPLLFVEVLSPSTARYDRITKRQRYQRYGVEYWIVDLDARLVERWTPDADRPEIAIESITWQPTGITAPLIIQLDALFAEIHGER